MGEHATAEQAAIAYDRAAILNIEESHLLLNFPNRVELEPTPDATPLDYAPFYIITNTNATSTSSSSVSSPSSSSVYSLTSSTSSSSSSSSSHFTAVPYRVAQPVPEPYGALLSTSLDGLKGLQRTVFRNKKKLNNLSKGHGPSSGNGDLYGRVPQPERSKKFLNINTTIPCEICGKMYKTKKSMKQHMQNVHATNKGNQPTSKK